MISQVFPILSTPDLPRTLAFYRDLLGGTVEFEFPDPDGQVVYAGGPRPRPRRQRGDHRATGSRLSAVGR